jgi:light-regulated signal transduction histidine kinase (bacteriophytochrome)
VRRGREELESRVRERTAELDQANRELKRSNQELQRFAFIASHDLQEPLRKIRSFGDLLLSGHSAGLDEVGRDYLKRMQAAAGRMSALIDSLLKYSQVSTQALPFARVDLAKAVREAVSDLRVRLLETGGRVDVGELPALEGDPTQLRQLLQNLIGNALKFHRPGVAPEVEVRAEVLAAGSGPAELGVVPACRLVVRDNGIGFDDRHRERIFDMFHRLHRHGEYEGTGVGLSICKKIVERHGGVITASGVEGQGATFTVTLPITHRMEDEG